MKLILSIFFISITSISYAKIDVKVYYEVSKNGYEIYVDNNEFCPVSVKIDFKLLNLRSSKGNGKIFIIPAKTKKQSVTSLTKIKSGKYKFSFKTRYNYGDHFLKTFNNLHHYSLPFENDNAFIISQGYNGSDTHQGKNALDFKMPIGTNITAIKEGVIIKVVDTNTKTCYKEECKKFNNTILVYHKDGTFTEYLHIDTNSALIKVGDEIQLGQVIAKSGNIGWSSGPHLHIEVFLPRLENRKTLKTKFKVNDGTTAEFLLEEKTYARGYN